jgi:hypothetical protein
VVSEPCGLHGCGQRTFLGVSQQLAASVVSEQVPRDVPVSCGHGLAHHAGGGARRVELLNAVGEVDHGTAQELGRVIELKVEATIALIAEPVGRVEE